MMIEFCAETLVLCLKLVTPAGYFWNCNVKNEELLKYVKSFLVAKYSEHL